MRDRIKIVVVNMATGSKLSRDYKKPEKITESVIEKFLDRQEAMIDKLSRGTYDKFNCVYYYRGKTYDSFFSLLSYLRDCYSRG